MAIKCEHLSITVYFKRFGFDFVWFSRAVQRLDAARAQKEIPESTRTVKQQELHKNLRV